MISQMRRMIARLRPFRLVAYALMICLALATAAPFIWMLSTAFKLPKQVYSWPPSLLPNPWMFSNFPFAWKAAPFGRFCINTCIVCALIIIERLLFSTLAAYAFARLDFPGRNLWFTLLLATMMIPGQVTLVPVFLITKRLGWLNTYQGLALPSLASAFIIFWLRQFFMTIPRELEEAARIDGASRFRILWRIVIPLSKPAIATLTLFSFNEGWNMFLWPLIATTKQDMRTIEVGLSFLRLQLGGQTAAYEIPALRAGNTMAIMPVILVYLVLQRQFVQGIALTGLKG